MLKKWLAVLLAVIMMVSMIPPVSAAANDYIATITVVDGYGEPIPGATVTVTRVYQTPGGNQRTSKLTVTAVGDGTYTFSTLATGTTLHYTINAVKDGYPAVTQQIDPDSRSIVVMLGDPIDEPDYVDEWVPFEVYYIATGITPESFTAPGNFLDYGPSGNDVPLLIMNVNVGKLKSKKYADCVVYEENNGNIWHFIPAGDIVNGTEAEKRLLIEPFWKAIVECMHPDSVKAFEETGLFGSYMSYVLKNQGHSALEPDNHSDGILSVEPPVYVVELYDHYNYFGGFVNDKTTSVFTTYEDVIEAYNTHFDHTHGTTHKIDFVKQDDGTYLGTYVEGKIKYYVQIAQTNAHLAEHRPDENNTASVVYQQRSERYYFATFNASVIWEEQIVFDVIYTDGLGGAVFADQITNHAPWSYISSFDGDSTRENFTLVGWTLQGGDGTVMTQEEIIQNYTWVTSDMTFVAAYELKPQTFAGTVEVVLNGEFIDGAAVGERVDITTVKGDVELYVSADGINYIKLEKTATGVYSAHLENGSYHIYYFDGNGYMLTGHGQQLDIYDAARTRYLFFNDVIYDVNGGVGGPVPNLEYHRTGDAVTVSSVVPTKEDHEFLGWLAEDGTLYAAGAVLTDAINAPYRLTAQWKKINKAKVNVTIIVDGKSADGTVDQNLDREMTIELTYRPFGSTDDYVEVLGQSFTDKDGYYIGETVGNVTTTVYNDLFTDLDIAYEYAANAFMSEYEVLLNGRTVTSTTDANGDITYDVVIRMQYAPEMRMLEYTVVEDIENDNFVPSAVDVKILAFYNPSLYGFAVPDEKAWHPLTQHMDTTHDAFFDMQDANGNWCGKESYIVWTWEDQEQNLPYYYRVSAAGLTLKDGTELTLVSTDGIHYVSLASANGLYPAGAYTADVSVQGGDSPDGNALTGAYFTHEHDDQIGSITITVYAHPYNVIFDPNGGTLNGTTDNTVVPDQFIVPDTKAYVPTRDDSYVFDRWVLADEDGNPTDQTVTAGEALTRDITLVALWKAPKTINGLVTVGATYQQQGNDGGWTTQHIHEKDYAKTAIVLLQRNAPNGYFETVSSMTLSLDYSKEEYYHYGLTVGMAEYEFTNVPDDGSVYSIYLLLPNYLPMFQNEPESIRKWKDYPTYTTEDYTVLWGENDPQTGTVNIHNHFEPEEFTLQYEVDSTAIGDGFRPDSVELLVTYDINVGDVNPSTWTVISQMDFDGGYRGDDVALEDGLGNGETPVWISSMDGVTYYQYGLRVNSTTFGGVKYALDGTQPFTVSYQAPTHYHYGAQEQILKAILTPKTYNVHYVLNGGTMRGDYPTSHTWSYETSLDMQDPTMSGFRFEGWYLDADFTIPAGDVIAANVAADTTLYAKWLQVMDRVDLTVIINHQQANGSGLASNYNKDLVAQLTCDSRKNEGAATREFVAMDGYKRTYPDGLWHTRGDDVLQDIFQVPAFYTNLSSEYDYSANVTLDGYYVVSKKTDKIAQPDGSTLHKVTVVLQYYPDLFDLEFYVRLSDHVKNGEKPVSAQVKVTAWSDNPSEEVNWAWEHITQHETTSVTVNIDSETGIGFGSYPVWHWYDEAEQIPYYYRLEVVQLNFADGSSVFMNSLVEDVVTAGNGYTATVETKGGAVPQIADANNTTTLEGVYGLKAEEGHAQQGTLGAVIDLNRVVFHANNENYEGDDVFRTYYYDKMPQMGESDYVLENGKVPTFYDIPEFDYVMHNNYIFKGWYMDPVSEDEPFNWNSTQSGDVHVYAHWITVGDIAQEEADSKIVSNSTYHEYDLTGVQIRDKDLDKMEHYGNPASGLRFITVLSERVYGEINNITGADAEYGFVIAKTSTLLDNIDGEGYTLQYKAANVNGVDTTAAYGFVQNIRCDGVVDHYEGETYRLYTAVITYNGLEGAALEAAYATDFTARSYIRYTDANGLLRTYYNNYNGQAPTAGGCTTSFADVQGMMGA